MGHWDCGNSQNERVKYCQTSSAMIRNDAIDGFIWRWRQCKVQQNVFNSCLRDWSQDEEIVEFTFSFRIFYILCPTLKYSFLLRLSQNNFWIPPAHLSHKEERESIHDKTRLIWLGVVINFPIRLMVESILLPVFYLDCCKCAMEFLWYSSVNECPLNERSSWAACRANPFIIMPFSGAWS